MRAQAEQDSGLTDEQWVDRQVTTFQHVIASGGYSTMAALIDEGDLDLDLESVFEFGLRRLLDGYAALIEQRPPAEPQLSPGS
ncbi:TetR/AcrR family transcriptional regulator C-terminal domain-containing protein [Micromonospora sp. NPDC000668]|uniref:TetR/AcrR family transcriptional regulator C-terminal domain-containing protein n=1 Tax=Micromonospora sp. NPDC000668 TaxID=3364219 RepID=UPI0036BF0524